MFMFLSNARSFPPGIRAYRRANGRSRATGHVVRSGSGRNVVLHCTYCRERLCSYARESERHMGSEFSAGHNCPLQIGYELVAARPFSGVSIGRIVGTALASGAAAVGAVGMLVGLVC